MELFSLPTRWENGVKCMYVHKIEEKQGKKMSFNPRVLLSCIGNRIFPCSLKNILSRKSRKGKMNTCCKENVETFKKHAYRIKRK